MSDTAETADGTIRLWLAAAGFACVFIGLELIVLNGSIAAGLILLVLSVAFYWVYPVHVTTRKSLGLMMRKLSVTESQRSAQLRGTISRRKPSVASANWAQVA